MNRFDDKFKTPILEESLNLFDLLQNEHKIPPMYSCLQIGGFCFANVLRSYDKQGKEPPEELVKFMADTWPKLMANQEHFIDEQYLSLNTEGTA